MNLIYCENVSKYAIFRAAILCIMSIATFIFPDFLLNGMVYVIAGYMVLNGALCIADCFTHNKEAKTPINYVSFVLACLLIVLGIFFIAYYRYIVSILPVFLGALMIAESIVCFVTALCTKAVIRPLLIVLAVIIFIGGAASVIYTLGFGGLPTLSQIFGVLLLLSCIYELAVYLSRRKAAQ